MRDISQGPGSGDVRPGVARVLVVEDEPIVGMDIEAILSDAGMKVVGPVTSAIEALELIGPGQVECALIDFVLTDGTAVDIVAKLTDNSIPFAFVTGLSREGIPDKYCNIPTVGKPFAAAELINCVRSMCAKVHHA